MTRYCRVFKGNLYRRLISSVTEILSFKLRCFKSYRYIAKMIPFQHRNVLPKLETGRIYIVLEDLASRLRQTANVRPKFPVYQKLVKFIWFQLIFCLLATAIEQVLKTEK